MMHDTHPALSAQTFASWHWHLLEAPELYFRAGSDPKLTTESAAEEARRLRENEAELQALRRETTDGHAPLYLALPVQAITIIFWLALVSVACIAAVVFGVLNIAGEGLRAIGRGLRWATC